jgi:hypothetical protein
MPSFILDLSPLRIAVVALAPAALAACGDAASLDAFAPHSLGAPATWGQGIDGFDPAGGLPGDTGGGGGGTDAYDGTWQGSYSVTTYLADYSLSCSCTANLTLVVEGGDIVVGFGETCALDCGISTQLGFDGAVGGDGSASGTVDENLSFYYSVPWTGSFAATAASGSFNEAGLATSQGNTDVSGSFSVAPAR